MTNATLIVLLALLQYFFFTIKVGLGRGKYKVDAPSCGGDEQFERLFRVQQNTLEQLIIFIPAALAFAFYLSPVWVLGPGILFILGRFAYAAEYTKDPKTRTPGMVLTILANVSLIVGALVGLIIRMV